MGRKEFSPLVDVTKGLNTASNPITLPPGSMVDGENFVICKPYGFQNLLSELNHVLQSRPPMFQSFTGNFDVSIALSPTEVKPLIGATQAPSDSIPGQWQSLFLGFGTEPWAISGHSPTGGADTILFETPGLTSSDGNNTKIDQTSAGIDAGLTNKLLSVQLTSPYTSGLIGNNSTLLFIDYTEMYKYSQSVGPLTAGIISTLTLRIGTDLNNYLQYTLPVGSLGSPPPNIVTKTYTDPSAGNVTLSYGLYRYSVNLRNFNSKTGSKTFGEIVSNLSFCTIIAIPTGDYSGGFFHSDGVTHETVFSVDNVRLDVDYSGFFGDYTVGQPYQQVTISTLDLNSKLSNVTWVLDAGYYKERRLSIGNGCLALEADVSGTYNAVGTLSKAIDSTPTWFPQIVLLDYRVEHHANITSFEIRIGTDSSNYYKKLVNSFSADGNFMFSGALSSFTKVGNPTNSNLKYTAIISIVTTAAEPNTPRLYFNNLRFAPYTVGPGFPAGSGNLRDMMIYESTNGGESDRFIMACGDALFLGATALGASSFYVEGGFTNWNPPTHVFDQPFVGVIAANPNYQKSGSAALAKFTFVGNPVAGNVISVNGTEFTFVAQSNSATQENQITIGGSIAETVQNAASVISSFFVDSFNAAPDDLNTSILDVQNTQIGASGNSITVTSNTSNITLPSPTLTGGVDPFAQPQNLMMIVNSKDGLWSVGIINYVNADGSLYPYPTVTQVDTRQFSTAEVFNGRVAVAGDPNNPNRVVFSDQNDCLTYQPGTFTELDLQGFIVTGDSIKALLRFEDVLLVCRSTGIFIFYGTSPFNFSQKPTSAEFGPMNPRHILIADRRIFLMGFNGVFELVNYHTVKISDPINDNFQTNNIQMMQSSYLSYNPIRQVVMANLIREYNADPIVGINNDYSVERFLFSTQKNAWSRIRKLTDTNPLWCPFSAAYFGGESGTPSFFESSTTLLQWDKTGNDVATWTAKAVFSPMSMGNPHQMKTFDKVFSHFVNPIVSPGGAEIQISYCTQLIGGTFSSLATACVPDADNRIEEMFDSGVIGRSISLQFSNGIPGSINYTTPVQMLDFAVSWFSGEML